MKRLSAAANVGLFLSLLIALYVGFRAPSLWSVNYYIPSVFDGFWRRSLLGTLLYPLGALRFDYHFVAALQGLVLLVLMVLALFVHEMAALTVIPLYLAALVVADRWREAFVHGLLLAAVFAVIYF